MVIVYPIEMSLSTPKKTAFHLQKNVLRRVGVNDNQTDYYYLEVEKDEEGEITLDLKRGSGIMFAKIVQKDTSSIKEKALARKVVLPTEKDFDKELTYDSCTQKIRYNRVVTSKCLNGCFIVFLLQKTILKNTKTYLPLNIQLFQDLLKEEKLI